jgi:putative acetyltransferase
LPKYRSQGVGLALFERLEQAARDLQVTRLVLETGIRQPESQGLYAKVGFAQIPLFGEYRNSPLSICMEKRIGPRR